MSSFSEKKGSLIYFLAIVLLILDILLGFNEEKKKNVPRKCHISNAYVQNYWNQKIEIRPFKNTPILTFWLKHILLYFQTHPRLHTIAKSEEKNIHCKSTSSVKN